MNIDIKILEKLYNLAIKAYKKGEIPVSAIILDKNNKIISAEYNNRQNEYNILGHAEILAIQKAEKKIKDWRLDGYKMIVSLEPCDMCSMIINKSRLDHVYYILSSDSNDKSKVYNIEKTKIKINKEFEIKFQKLLTDFFDNKR